MMMTCGYTPRIRIPRHGMAQGGTCTLQLLPMHTVRFLSPSSKNVRLGPCKLKLNSKRDFRSFGERFRRSPFGSTFSRKRVNMTEVTQNAAV